MAGVRVSPLAKDGHCASGERNLACLAALPGPNSHDPVHDVDVGHVDGCAFAATQRALAKEGEERLVAAPDDRVRVTGIEQCLNLVVVDVPPETA